MQVLERLDEFVAQGLSIVLWALARMRCRPTGRWLALLLQALVQRLQHGEAHPLEAAADTRHRGTQNRSSDSRHAGSSSSPSALDKRKDGSGAQLDRDAQDRRTARGHAQVRFLPE